MHPIQVRKGYRKLEIEYASVQSAPLLAPKAAFASRGGFYLASASFRFPFVIPLGSILHQTGMRLPRMDTAKLTLVRQPFDHPDFLFELKHDGFRALAYISEGKCQLVSRNRNSYKSFSELRKNLAGLKVRNAVIDGELVCLDDEGRSVFNELLYRKGHPAFYVFDLLYLNDRDLRQRPLVERKLMLRELIDNSELLDVVCGKYVEGRGVDLFREVCERNLEGVVAKRKTGTYAAVSGWLKIKNPSYTGSERRHELFESFKAKRPRRELRLVPKKALRRP